jgi:hypothetical protein
MQMLHKRFYYFTGSLILCLVVDIILIYKEVVRFIVVVCLFS